MKRVKSRRGRAKGFAASLTDLERSRLRLFGVALVCAKLALVPVVIDPASDLPFIVPKVLLSHGLSYVLAGAVAGLAIRFGRDVFVRSWLHVPVIAYLLVSVAASAVAADRGLALYGTHARMLGLGSIADGILLYFAVVTLVRRRAETVAVLASVLTASTVVLGYEIIQLAGKDPLSWSFDGSISPFSTLGQPTTLAYYFTIVALAAFALGVCLRELGRPTRLILVSLAAVLVAGSAATGTRSSVIGLTTGSGILVLLLWLRMSTGRARALTAFGVLVVGAGLAVVIAASPVGTRLTTTIQQPGVDEGDEGVVSRLDPSSVSRLALYGIALEMVLDRPLLGYGPDNFVVGVPEYRPETAPRPIRQSLATSAHSWAAYMGTSSGLLGLCAFVAIVGVALVLVFRGREDPLMPVASSAFGAYLGAGLTTVTDVTTDALLWLSVGAIAAIANRRSDPSEQPELRDARAKRPTRPQGFGFHQGLAMLFVAIGVMLMGATASAAQASREARTSQDSRLLGATPRAIEAGLRATQLDPGRAEYWHQLGLAYVSGARWREAGAAFDRAMKLAPYDIRNTTDLIAVQLALLAGGESAARETAVQLADQAVLIDRNNPGAQLTRAVVMRATGDAAEARLSIERALDLDPLSTNERLYGTAAQIYLDLGRSADAVRVARQGRTVIGVTRTSALGFELARALLADGQTREALTEIDLVLSIQPNYPAAERLRAEIRARLGS